MASVFKPKGKSRYVILYFDESGRRRKKVGAGDKQSTERIARELENRVALLREGVIDGKAEARRGHEKTPLPAHVAAWEAAMLARGLTPGYATIASNRVRRLAAVVLGDAPGAHDVRRLLNHQRAESTARLTRAIARGRLSHLTLEAVQAALGAMRGAGTAAQTLNHYRAAVRAFVAWCRLTGRLGDDPLMGLAPYNAKEDPRHDRRTLSLEDARRLVAAAHASEATRYGLDGPTRSLLYRLAMGTGLRYSEIAGLRPVDFDPDGPSVTVLAAYAKDGETATLPLPPDLAADLAPYLAGRDPSAPAWRLPPHKGAELLRYDLARAGIPYRDAAGRCFDFHSLRCQAATLLDAAGVSPRVVQRIMRHSTLELTGRYTRPRAVALEAAAESMPALAPGATGDATRHQELRRKSV
jgi:integrase